MKLGNCSFARGDIVLFRPHHLEDDIGRSHLAFADAQPAAIDLPSSGEGGWVVGVIAGLPLEEMPGGATESPERSIMGERHGTPLPKHRRLAWNRMLFRVLVLGRAGSALNRLADTLKDMSHVENDNEEVEVLERAPADPTKGQKPSIAVPEWRAEVRDRIVAEVRRNHHQVGADFDHNEFFLEWVNSNKDLVPDWVNANNELVPLHKMLDKLGLIGIQSDDSLSMGGDDDPHTTFLHESALRRPSEIKVERSLMLWHIAPSVARADARIKVRMSFALWKEGAAAHAKEEYRLRDRSARALQSQARRYCHRRTLADLRLRRAEEYERKKWERLHKSFSYVDPSLRMGGKVDENNKRRYNVRGTKVLLPTLSSAKRWFDLMREKVDRFIEITDARLVGLYACVFELWREMMASQTEEVRLMEQEEILQLRIMPQGFDPKLDDKHSHLSSTQLLQNDADNSSAFDLLESRQQRVQ